jgi:uncharacterized protein YndB with AHSA1/START domain
VTSSELEIELSEDEPVVVFRRLVGAPPSLVFEAWTEPDHLRHWWGPRGFALVVCESDLRVGGQYRFVQRTPDGEEHGFRGQYREVERPHRLVRTFVYEGAPEQESVETVTFERERRGTLVTGESVFPSFAALDLYTRAGMEFGMRESHQRLDGWLETVQNESDRRGR